MHPIVQVCSLVLLSAAAGAVRSLHGQVPVKLAEVDPYKWAVHDWVPEKNRRTDERSMPIGAGELEPVPPDQDQHRMPKNHPKNKATRNSRKQNSHKVKDVLKKHILNSYQNARGEKYDKAQQRRRSHGKRSCGKSRKMQVFPQDLEKSEEKKFQLLNKDIRVKSQYNGDLFMPVYQQVLDHVKSYKNIEKEHSRRLMHKQLMEQQEEAAKKLLRG